MCIRPVNLQRGKLVAVFEPMNRPLRMISDESLFSEHLIERQPHELTHPDP